MISSQLSDVSPAGPIPLIGSAGPLSKSLKFPAATLAFGKHLHRDEAEGIHFGSDLDLHPSIVFPEAFVSAYPRGLSFGAVVGDRTPEGREQYRCYWESSMDIPGPAMEEPACTGGRAPRACLKTLSSRYVCNQKLAIDF